MSSQCYELLLLRIILYLCRVQQAYCLQQMGKEKEAMTIYQNVLKDKPSDQALVAIASNNIVVINR